MPHALMLFNKEMGEVDQLGQFLATHRARIRSKTESGRFFHEVSMQL